MPNFDLNGRVAVVTGSSEGIGAGIALGLAEAGADLVLASRTREKLVVVAEQARSMGRRAIAVPTDVTDPQATRALIAAAQAAFGRVDILVNNAGGSFGANFRRGPLLTLDEHDFDGCYDLNVKSLFLCAKAAVPVMQAQGKGSIINVSSIAGGGHEPANPGFGLYGSSKAAAISLTRYMSVEWAPQVRVNCILPGVVDTERTSRNRTPEVAAVMAGRVALGRLGVPADIAGAAVFLASDASEWCTGSTVEVSGGLKGGDQRRFGGER